jgi:hypothetical protein
MTDVNAVFSTDTTGIELSTLPNGAFYLEQKGYVRPRLAKGYFISPERIKTYAIANAAFVGAVDDRTAALMPDYPQRWTRPNQRELLETIAGRREPAVSGQATVADTEEGDEPMSLNWDELNEMLPQVPQDLIDKANRAEELDRVARRITAAVSEQVELDGRIHAAQSARVCGQGGPAPGPGDVHDMSGAAVEDVSGQEQLVDLAGADSVEFAEHHGRMAQRFSEL